jgi:hypothetical protein
MRYYFEISKDGGNWQSVPEQTFYDSLYRHAQRITPLVKEMLNSKEVACGNTRYRIIYFEEE